jgi:hypothetical protein
MSWRLFAVNSTTVTPTPTSSTPTPSPSPETLNLIIKADPINGLLNLNVTVAGNKIPLLASDITTEGYHITFHVGDTLRFQVEPTSDYVLYRWDFSNANPVVGTENPLVLLNVDESFTLTAKFTPST